MNTTKKKPQSPVRWILIILAGFIQLVLVVGGCMFYADTFKSLFPAALSNLSTPAFIALGLFSLLWPVYLFHNIFFNDFYDDPDA